jgi:hypothetical protein
VIRGIERRKIFSDDADLCLCGLILAEVLQGIRSDEEYIKTKEYLDDLVFLPMQQATFMRAADVYRSLRKRGVTIRKPVDCVIASVAIEQDIPRPRLRLYGQVLEPQSLRLKRRESFPEDRMEPRSLKSTYTRNE